jgi:hypothetical protein
LRDAPTFSFLPREPDDALGVKIGRYHAEKAASRGDTGRPEK